MASVLQDPTYDAPFEMEAMTFFPKAAAKGSFKKSAVIKHCYQTLPKVLLK